MRNYNYIVILCYNRFDLTDLLLNDLLACEEDNIDKILVVDNGSTDSEVEDGLGQWIKYGVLPISVIRLEKNLGFTLGANYGLKIASGDIAEKRAVFLISNDVRIYGKFIQQTDNILFGARRALVGNERLSYNTGWNEFNGVVYDYLAGHFLAATSDGWRDLNYFDEAYAPMDYEDVDLSTTAKKKGYKLVALNNPNIVHSGAGTYGYTVERRLQTERNREVFRRKWVK